ncbi:hypothetical protein [Bordetella sp. 2513F-2]
MGTLLAALAILAATPAYADVTELEQRLPKEVEGMRLLKVQTLPQEGGKIVAHYGESVGRGTVYLIPAPDAGSKFEGPSQLAQLAMLEAAANNIRQGTKALGESYESGVVVASTVKVSSLMLTCSSLERRQREQKDPLNLRDLQCFFQISDSIVGIMVTTPFKNAMRQKIADAQLKYVAATALMLSSRERKN